MRKSALFQFARLASVALGLGLAALAGLGVQACSSGDHPAPIGGNGDMNLQGPLPGSPCDQEGATRECGRVERTYGTYVTCSMGNQTCEQGHWSACVGNHFVTQS